MIHATVKIYEGATPCRQHLILCSFCKSGELVALVPNLSRCGSCTLPLLGAAPKAREGAYIRTKYPNDWMNEGARNDGF